MAIQMYCKADPKYRRGHVEMVYHATNLLNEYGLEKDLDAYKMIFDLFPKVLDDSNEFGKEGPKYGGAMTEEENNKEGKRVLKRIFGWRINCEKGE